MADDDAMNVGDVWRSSRTWWRVLYLDAGRVHLEGPRGSLRVDHYRDQSLSEPFHTMTRQGFEAWTRKSRAVRFRAMANAAPPSYRDDLAQAYSELELRLGDALREVDRLKSTDPTVGGDGGPPIQADRIAALEAGNASLLGRVGELESYSHELASNLDAKNEKDQETEAYQYLKRLFLHMAPQSCVLPDLLGVCTQLDNAIAGLKVALAALNLQAHQAALTVANATPAPEPKTFPASALKLSKSDPRRMGGG